MLFFYLFHESQHAMKYEGLEKPELKWKFTKGAPKMPSPILVGNELYYVMTMALLTVGCPNR